MKSFLFMLLMLVALFLVGCAGSGGVMPITEETVNRSGEVVEKAIGYTKDASVAKEHEVHSSLRTGIRSTANMYQQSGFKMEFDMMEVAPGVKAYLPRSLEFRERPPEIIAQLPKEPSKHPVWKFAESVGNNIVDKTFFGWAFSELTSFGKTLAGNDKRTYNGPYAPSNSDNVFDGINGGTVMPYEVRPEVVLPEVVMVPAE